MALVTKLDALELLDLSLPYNKQVGELTDERRLVWGTNTEITSGGKLVRRPGTIQFTVPLGAPTTSTKRCYRLASIEPMTTGGYYYLIGSFYNTSTSFYEAYYLDVTLGAPLGWVKFPDLRGVNSSIFPHEFVVHRSKAYVKAFPGSSVDKLGCVIFDPNLGSPLIKFWGLLGPTTAARVNNPATWSSQKCDHNYTVNYGWKYSYAWVTNNGHVSCRAPLETNPDKNPSDTGPYVGVASTGYCPEIVVQGDADTTRIPYINIYRTSDGGGTFYFVKQITNTGAGNITFVDKYLGSGVSGTTYKDPLPDAELDTSQIAPSETSNLPPPTCIPPGVVGTDTIQHSTSIVVYAGRLWFAIGNYLYYSALEEITEGVPEESFVGGLRGNYFRLPLKINNLAASSDALYVMTYSATYRVTGSDKETFNLKPFLSDIGSPEGHPQAVCSIGDTLAWLTQDYRVVTVNNSSVNSLSDPLMDDIRSALVSVGECQLYHWAELDRDYLVVNIHKTTCTESRQWICDLNRTARTGKPFWFPAWTVPTSAAYCGRITPLQSYSKILMAVWSGTVTNFVFFDLRSNTTTDYYNSTATNYDVGFDTYLMKIPPGNHVNMLSEPARVPAIHQVIINRTDFGGESDPVVKYFIDDFWTSPQEPLTEEDPPRRDVSKSYKSMYYNINRVGQRFALRVQYNNSASPFELHSIITIFNPGGGT